MSARGWIIAAALFGLGCAQNAVLEIVLTLPEAPADDGTGLPWYGIVQVNRATDSGFSTPREGGGQSPLPLELGTEPALDCISVQSTDEAMDVEVRVRFCRDIDCLNLEEDSNPPERYFRLEHPFYIGRRTYWYGAIESVPECTVDADCAAGRCIAERCGCTTNADCCVDGCACPDGTDPVGGTCLTCEDGPDSEAPGVDPTVDSCVQTINRCHIQGCTTGAASNFCSLRDDMPHFCEGANWADRVDTYPPACMSE